MRLELLFNIETIETTSRERNGRYTVFVEF